MGLRGPDEPFELEQRAVSPPAEVEDNNLEAERKSLKVLNGFSRYFLVTLRVRREQMIPHAKQRPLDRQHVQNLVQSFLTNGILRSSGYNVMAGAIRNIRDKSQLPPEFEDLPREFTVEVTSGNHRTHATDEYVALTGRKDQGYWFVSIYSCGEPYKK